MLRLAKASQSDVFYDLGCGAGLVCCLAVREFKGKWAVGIEDYKPRIRRLDTLSVDMCEVTELKFGIKN